MSINPRDYDLNELRRMARERGGKTGTGGTEADEADIGLGSVGPSDESLGSGGSFRAGLYRELLPLEAGSDASKPYLHGLPEHYAGEHLVFEWLEFLLLHAGYQGAMEALDYYESVGWITEDCESTLHDYLLGLDDATANDGNDLDIDDHLLSLVYIAKLSSMQ
jgi:flagellar protein FlaE